MGERILLVEDGRQLANLLRIVLEDAGYEVAVAGSVSEGARFLEQQTVSLVLTDSFSLSPAGAVEGAQLLCERAGSAPVALMTGHRVDLREALERGYCDVILKPFELDDLVRRVKVYLSQAPVSPNL
jgi:DNA-binding response OmpR family regulator